jgi:hypothetical protein
MSEQDQSRPSGIAITERDQAALERLRDRTDELELIISSLTVFALFSIPGWVLDLYTAYSTHLSTSVAIASNLSTTLLVGLCYGLAVCFVIHLMVRAYWVGLIGLRAAFPQGINWERTPTLGPITREAYRQMLPSLGDVIEGADRLASSLFAVISMLTLVVLWFGTLVTVLLVTAGNIGSHFGATNAALGLTALLILVVFLGLPILVYLLDAQLAARFPVLEHSRLFGWLIGGLRRVANIVIPQRLLLPVQLTLQSNTRPLLFFLTTIGAVFFILWAGNWRVLAWRNFTISEEFVYLSNSDVQAGFRSTYYEDMTSPRDTLRAWPRLSSFVQTGTTLRLFIPYHPLRDNPLLENLCGEETGAACLSKLWQIRLAGRDIPLDNFVAAQRDDINMRGLIGVVPLDGLSPGLHLLEVDWNTKTAQDLDAVDDIYDGVLTSFRIPFSFAPDYERALPDAE